MQLNYRDSKPIYEQIKEGIRRMIVMNVIKQDEKLPSVRVLACKYAINPNTIAKAYRELEEEGYLYTKSGKGTFVADAKTARQSLTRNLKILFDQVVTELFVLERSVEELKTRMDDEYEEDWDYDWDDLDDEFCEDDECCCTDKDVDDSVKVEQA